MIEQQIIPAPRRRSAKQTNFFFFIEKVLWLKVYFHGRKIEVVTAMSSNAVHTLVIL